jgi:5'(3')-deoxyribonucleotidase
VKYQKDPDRFSIQYKRKTINREINPDIEKNIIKELKIEKDLIKNRDMRLIRTYYRENVRVIPESQLILKNLLQKYNFRIVHSTSGEIPYIRFQRVIREKRSLFREFRIRPPFLSSKDIFCLRVERMVSPYRKVSINNLELKVPSAPLYKKIQLRIIPDKESGISEVRFWYKDEFLGS